MKQKTYFKIISITLLCLFFLTNGCKIIQNTTTAATTGTIIFDNNTGQRLRAYINGIFMDFIEKGQQRSWDNNPPGAYELKADNFSTGVWGPQRIDLKAGDTYTWQLY